MSLNPDQYGVVAIAAAISFLVGALIAWLIGRRAAHRAGRASRDVEVSQLAGERDANLETRRRLQQEQEFATRELTESRHRIVEISEQRAALEGRLERLSMVESELAAARGQVSHWNEACQRAEQRLTEALTRLQEASDRELLLKQVREDFADRFKTLSGEVLDQQSQKFTEQNQNNLGTLLNPLRDQLGDFRKLVSESYEKENIARVALQTELKSELKQLFDLNNRLSDEANSLARALTTENRTQGYWGELRLERLLEASGLEKGREYTTQESFVDGDGDRYRPDAIVRLPEGKDIIIDAKVALIAYRESCDAAEGAIRELALEKHVAAMRNHVRSLGEKNYSSLPGVQAPDLVLMFVPVEAAFLEALRHDPSLYEDAFARKIVMVGPSNLLASLRLIAHLWRTDQQTRNAELVFKRAAAMYDKFVGFVEDIENVGSAIDRAQKAQQSAMNKLVRGRGNLVRKADELRQLGAAPGKAISQALLDEAGDDDAQEMVKTSP
ncbi:MAG TPA: DNA recombination protein RmuC [Rudaea sp.]|jgi:DNA recombination protein RmuC|nr:DNA recombination protein RmuC [Rudaea sp.]